MKTIISKYTLFEYLAGRANPLERQLVEAWILDKENAETYNQWLFEFETKSPQFMPDQDAAIQYLLHRIETDIEPAAQPVKSNFENKKTSLFSSKTKGFWLMAASVTLMVGFGWWFREGLQYKTYQTAYGQTTDVYLEDGSKVALNSNSKLKIPRLGFGKKVRNVILEGEAEFSVSHTIDHKRFVVKTSDQFQVEVLGTTFSVFARPRGTKVALKSGSVRIDYAQDNERKEMMMEPGDLAVVDRSGGVKLAKKQDINNFATWKEKRYVFNSTSVREIVAMINENFGQQVVLSDPEMAQRTITGNFKTKNADELLKTISEVLDMKVEQNGNRILLTNH
jgi:ferric-dicitrate binding protein FerR (iron transport regulator)